MTRPTRSSNLSKANKARLLLAGQGVSREDSDDELGSEDLPWLWIYKTADGDLEEEEGGDAAEALNQGWSDKTRPTREIVGARMGDFTVRIGDTALLKADGVKKAWIGIVMQFLEDDEGDKAVELLWFSQEDEIRNAQKKREDYYANELYITPVKDVNKIETINGKAIVVSEEAFFTKYPGGKAPRNTREFNKTFICRRGCNTRTATYTDEFNWEDMYDGTEDSVEKLLDLVVKETKATRKRKKAGYGDDQVLASPKSQLTIKFVVTDDILDDEPRTPRKKRKLDLATPKSQRINTTPRKYTTPTHKNILVKKPLEFTPLGTRILSPANTNASPFQVARARLHVAAVPEALPCREAEFQAVYDHLEAAITDGSGSCIYISGTPGTGKTATVREVVAQLNAAVQADELDDFIFVEINGMKITDPHQSYSLLWEALRGDRLSPTHALDLLEREFSQPSPRRVPVVVLMDELDQLVTKNQSVMYNFFNWPGLRHSRLIVLAVANTMDLPERTLSNKISSRLGLIRITFPGYTHDQLMKIIQSRLEGVPGSIVDPDAIQFASRKVAAVSGDARRALDICRRAVEIAEQDAQEHDDDTPVTPSKRGRKENTAPQKAKVTITTVKKAITEATTSPLQIYLRNLPLAAKLLLAALTAKMRIGDPNELTLGKVIDQAHYMGKTAKSPHIQNFLTGSIKTQDLKRVYTPHPRTQAMAGSVVALVEGGIIVVEARKGERTAKIRLSVREEEVKLALRDDAEVRDLGFAS